jgi:hypothetical protein
MPGNEKNAPGKGQKTLDQFFSRTSVCPENENPPREQQIDGGQSHQQAENDEALLRCRAPTRGRRFLDRRSAPAVTVAAAAAAGAAAAAQQERVSEDIDMGGDTAGENEDEDTAGEFEDETPIVTEVMTWEGGH